MANIDFSKVTNIYFNKDLLPSDYTEVKYVRSILPSGNKVDKMYVNTQVAGIDGCRIRGSIDNIGTDNSLYGARNEWTIIRFGFTIASEGSGKFVFMHANGDYRFNADTDIHFIDDNCSKPGYCLIDNQTPQKLDTGSVSDRPLYLFNDNSGPGGDYTGAATIYSAEFYKKQILVCKPIPCVYHYGQADAVVGFYDVVNKRFLTMYKKEGNPKLEAGPVVNKEITSIKDKDGNILWSKT